MKTDIITSKVPFWRWWGKQIGYNRAKANYLDALSGLSPLMLEEELKRLVKDALPGWHLHRNPISTPPPPLEGVTRACYPSGGEQ